MDAQIDMELYKVFYHVAKDLSFSKAAKQLFISQSAVSQNISQLEKKLNKSLFIRTTKKVALSKDGAMLLRFIEPAIHLIQTGENQLMEADALKQGHLHIGASDTICRYYLLDYLSKFHRLYPGIRIQVTNRTSIDCVTLLEKGQVDFIVVNTPNDYLTTDMTVKTVKQFNDVFVANNEFISLKDEIISYDTLTEYPILMLEPNTTTSEFISKRLSFKGTNLKPEVQLGSIDLLIDMAKIGIGISFIPDFCLKEDGELFVVNLEDQLPQRQLAVAFKKNHPLSLVSQQFINLLI